MLPVVQTLAGVRRRDAGGRAQHDAASGLILTSARPGGAPGPSPGGSPGGSAATRNASRAARSARAGPHSPSGCRGMALRPRGHAPAAAAAPNPVRPVLSERRIARKLPSGPPASPSLGIQSPSRATTQRRWRRFARHRRAARLPVAVKLDAPGLAHKTRRRRHHLRRSLGQERAQLEAAVRRVLAAGRDHDPDGVVLQPHGQGSVELIVNRRPARPTLFGVVITAVGIGGVLAEVLDDVAVRISRPVRAGRSAKERSASSVARACSMASAAGAGSIAPHSSRWSSPCRRPSTRTRTGWKSTSTRSSPDRRWPLPSMP